MLPERHLLQTVLAVLLGGLLLALSAAPARASGGISAAQLAEALAAARDGDTIVVDGGVYHGSLMIERAVTLLGRNRPVLDGDGSGTVLAIMAPDTTISGFVIRGSGSSLDDENAGIAVEAPHATITDNQFVDTLFGIYLREAHQSVVQGNQLQGKLLDVPRRGDAIRVWSSNDVLVENNVVHGGRDVVLWYSERLSIRGNEVSNGRYGLHFMYCDDALIENNRLLDNSVGAFLMYSRRLTMVGNTVAGNRGPSGYGIGMKDLDDAVVRDNLFLNNRIGAYLDGTPREVDSIGLFEGNVFAYNDIGVSLLPSVRHNTFSANSFVQNGEQVSVIGGGQAGANLWQADGTGNFWSDYAGYDADGDGRGDMAYRSERLFENLLRQHQALRLFVYSPVTDAVDLAAHTFPLVKPRPQLIDEAPLVAPRIPATPALPQAPRLAWAILGAGLLAAAAAVGALPRLQRRRYILTPAGATHVDHD